MVILDGKFCNFCRKFCNICNSVIRRFINRSQTDIIDFTSKFIDLEFIIEPVHEISHNVVCATSKVSDQPAHMRSLIRAFASRLSIL